MIIQRLCLLAVLSLVALGCGKGTVSGADVGSDEDASAAGPDSGSLPDAAATAEVDASSSPINNVAPLIVDQGPQGLTSLDVPYVSVTLCVPGTTTCQTIDHVTVDTGSSGMRVIASVLTLKLPQATATTGDSLAECFQFADGYTWGSVRMADIRIAGELATKLPIQVIADPAFTSVPGDCSSSGPSENTIPSFGSNGLIGINQIIPDCGDYCTGQSPETGAYYSCTGSSCTAVAVADADQVSNPLVFFAQDNNGALLQFPTVSTAGAATVSGSLIFGIGTEANNGLGSAKILTVDADGNFTTVFNGQTLDTSFIDSGTNTLSFNDSAIPTCRSGEADGFFCPTSTLILSAQNQGLNGVTSTVSFSVGNAAPMLASSDSVFIDLATPGIDDTSFDWGFPFFLGRSVYVAFDGTTTPGGPGPYFAY